MDKSDAGEGNHPPDHCAHVAEAYAHALRVRPLGKIRTNGMLLMFYFYRSLGMGFAFSSGAPPEAQS